jgi:hypothetical protein
MRASDFARVFRRYIFFAMLALLMSIVASGGAALASFRLPTTSPAAGFADPRASAPPSQAPGRGVATPQLSGPAGIVSSRPNPPRNPAVVLYDQYNNQGLSNITSQNFEAAFDAYDGFAADDFVVPAGQTWSINLVEVDGEYSTAGGPATSVNVFIYSNATGSLPGALNASRTNVAYTQGPAAGDFVVSLGSPIVLGAGTWWISVQSNQVSSTAGQWFWHNRAVTSNAGAAWQNPGGGFAVGCTSWGRRGVCVPSGSADPDQVFRLSGTLSTGATATPTPGACQPYSTTGSVTSSDLLMQGGLQHLQTSTCSTPTSCPGQMDNTPRHYDDYVFVNNSGLTQCVNVTIDTRNCGARNAPAGNRLMDSAAFFDFFGPSSSTLGGLCTNYLADTGNDPQLQVTYSFNVPDGQRFTVVVYETFPNGGCNSYGLTVNGCVTLESGPCVINFSDVHTTDYFYDPVHWLFCRGAISGYADGTFRPFANTTRGQLSKIVALAMGWDLVNPTYPTFNDVPNTHPFYQHVETAYAHGIIAGYECGGDGEPCPGQYFRPSKDVTRGQLSKIIVLAQSWAIDTTGGPHFVDVPPTNPFYGHIETAFNHGIISGYNCGGDGEPCPGTYFRWGNNATRGQISKIVYNAARGQ